MSHLLVRTLVPLTWLDAVFSVLTGWCACRGGGWDMGVCRGRWWDVGACWSLGSCGVTKCFVGVPGEVTFGPAWTSAAGGLSLALWVKVWGLAWLCSRSLGSFLARGGVDGKLVEDEAGWLIWGLLCSCGGGGGGGGGGGVAWLEVEAEMEPCRLFSASVWAATGGWATADWWAGFTGSAAAWVER